MLPKGTKRSAAVDAHPPRGGEDLVEMQLLRRADDVPDLVRMPALDPVLDGGEVRGGVEEPAVAFADEAGLVRQGGVVAEEDADCALADLGDALVKQAPDQRCEAVVVSALAQVLVEVDVEQGVHALEFLPRERDAPPPDFHVIRVALLELDQFLAALAEDLGIGLGEGVGFLIQADQLLDRGAVERLGVAPMFPAVNDLAKLRAPVAEMVIGDDAVAQEAGDTGEGIAEDGAADVADVHRLCHVGAREVGDDGLGLRGRRDAEHRVGGDGAEALFEVGGDDAEVDEPGAGDLRRLAQAGDVEAGDDLLGELAGIRALLFCQQHGDVGLVIAESRVGGDGDDGSYGRDGSQSGERGAQPALEHRGKGLHPLRFLENLEDFLGGVRGAEGLAHGAVVEELRDGGQGAEMGLELVLWHYEEDDEADRGVVEGLELDAVGGAAKRGDDVFHPVRGGVGDGDAEADAGAHGFLAGAEGAEDRLLVLGLDLPLGDQQLHQFHDGAPALGGFHFREYLFNREEVAKIHACCFMGADGREWATVTTGPGLTREIWEPLARPRAHPSPHFSSLARRAASMLWGCES